jgi:hypothetical protein
MRATSSRRPVLTALAVVVVAGACGPSHLLREYDFAGGTLAVETDLPAYPDVLMGPVTTDSRDPVQMVLDVATRAARELQVGTLEEKLDSAAARLDLGARIRARAGQRAGRYLGATVQDDVLSADYVLEFNILEYGLSATDWDATAYFFMDGEALLRDVGTGAEIWRAEVGANSPLGPAIYSAPRNAREVVTAAVLADLSVDDLVRALEELADFTVTQVTNRLRDDLREARRGG